jgi:hypothetical protein
LCVVSEDLRNDCVREGWLNRESKSALVNIDFAPRQSTDGSTGHERSIHQLFVITTYITVFPSIQVSHEAHCQRILETHIAADMTSVRQPFYNSRSEKLSL